MTFFSHRPQISNFPLFSLFQYIPLCFEKIIISPPTLTNFPPVLDKFTCFLHTLPVFRFPPTLTMMHLCITQCTYWTPLRQRTRRRDVKTRGGDLGGTGGPPLKFEVGGRPMHPSPQYLEKQCCKKSKESVTKKFF